MIMAICKYIRSWTFINEAGSAYNQCFGHLTSNFHVNLALHQAKLSRSRSGSEHGEHAGEGILRMLSSRTLLRLALCLTQKNPGRTAAFLLDRTSFARLALCHESRSAIADLSLHQVVFFCFSSVSTCTRSTFSCRLMLLALSNPFFARIRNANQVTTTFASVTKLKSPKTPVGTVTLELPSGECELSELDLKGSR